MTQQPPEQPTPPVPAPPPNPATPTAPGTPAPPPPETGKQPPWGDKPEDFNADEAWKLIQSLRKEKGGADPQLRSELDTLKQSQQQQRDALAAALGIKPEETSDADKLAQQVTTLQEQFTASQRRASLLEVTSELQIPAEFHGWLTATDPEGLKAQAQTLLPMVQATLAARGQEPLLVPGQVPPPVAPQFAPNPGQGQYGQASAQAIADAEYEKYYPQPTRK